MANTIRIKRSTGSSAPGSLENAELAFAEGSKKLFVGVGTGGSGGSATTIEPIGGSGSFADLFTSRTQNTFLAAPNGSNGAASFRAMVAADVPSLTASKISNFDTQVRTSRLDQMTAPTGSVGLNGQTITGLGAPVNATDAATKSFVESTAQGLDVKDSVVASTTANITISTALNNGDTLDGVTLSTNDRVLVKNQSTASENGIYIVGASPARSSDLAAGVDAAGMFTFVEQGTVNGDNGFVCTSNKGSAVVGTNNLTFAQFSGAGNITAGDGLDKSGNELSVDLKANGGLVIESTELAIDLAASSITGTLALGDGGTGATSASGARTALGLVIGTNVQAYDADLDALSSCQSGAAAALALLTATEVAILDGATLTTAELNIIDGDTSATSTTLASADRIVVNDNGTMKQVALSDLVTYFENGSVSGFDIDGGTF